MPEPRLTRARHHVLDRVRPADPPWTVTAVLGNRHPMARSAVLQATLARQIVVLMPIAAGASAAAMATRRPETEAVALAAAAVAAVLAALFWDSRRRVRRHAQHLILKGLEGVPLLAVARERDRLLARSHRETLAARLEAHGPDAADALRLAELLRLGHGRAQGIAYVDALLDRGVLTAGSDDDGAAGGEWRRAAELLGQA